MRTSFPMLLRQLHIFFSLCYALVLVMLCSCQNMENLFLKLTKRWIGWHVEHAKNNINGKTNEFICTSMFSFSMIYLKRRKGRDYAWKFICIDIWVILHAKFQVFSRRCGWFISFLFFFFFFLEKIKLAGTHTHYAHDCAEPKAFYEFPFSMRFRIYWYATLSTVPKSLWANFSVFSEHSQTTAHSQLTWVRQQEKIKHTQNLYFIAYRT